MSTPAYTIADIINNILVAIQNILGEVAKVIADNAAVFATLIVLGGLSALMVRYGRRIFAGVAGWLRGLF